jgi:hypothetical protein
VPTFIGLLGIGAAVKRQGRIRGPLVRRDIFVTAALGRAAFAYCLGAGCSLSQLADWRAVYQRMMEWWVRNP